MSDPQIQESPALFDKTLRNLKRAWRGVTRGGRSADQSAVRPDLPEGDADKLKGMIVACLEGRGGRVSARARAADLGETYLALNADGRLRFLRMLVEEFGTDVVARDAAIDALAHAASDEERRRAEDELRRCLVPRRVTLLMQFNGLPEGIKFLVDLRAEVRDALREHPDLAPLDRDMRDLLAAWFDVGLLRLERITWQAPAALLEKLAAYEAVHAIRSWQDLKNRLDSDRRCYAFFHPNMPGEPLIFVEVALVSGIADNIQGLLDEEAPADDPTLADTAIFYSISNAQRGLDGLSFGEFLIKQVVDDLSREMPQLTTFATLSPLPGFARWIEKERTAEVGEGLLSQTEEEALSALCDGMPGPEALACLLDKPRWSEDETAREALEPVLSRLAARYLLMAQRGDGQPVDPVARFHLSNGANVERLNWLADRSANGMRQSHGLMVNYRYRRDEIEANHEAFRGEGRIAASASVRSLAGLKRNGRG